jgi:hypothetical protein
VSFTTIILRIASQREFNVVVVVVVVDFVIDSVRKLLDTPSHKADSCQFQEFSFMNQ